MIPHSNSADDDTYIEHMFAFEYRREPWNSKLVDFLAYPTSAEAVTGFLDTNIKPDGSAVIMKYWRPDGKDHWGAISVSSLDAKEAEKLLLFADEIFDKVCQDGEVTIPSETRGDAVTEHSLPN